MANQLQRSAHRIQELLRKETPLILSVLGVGGFISATIMAVKATPAAMVVLEDHETLPTEKRDRVLAQVKLLLPIYAPATGVLLMSTALVLGSSVVADHRYSALTTMYALSQQRLMDWQAQVLESVGPTKYEEMESEVIAKRAATKDLPEGTPDDGVLCYDDMSARYFTVPRVEDLRGIVHDLNDTLLAQMYITINDLYFELGLDPVQYGNDIGWAIENGMLKLQYRSMLTEDKRPCVAISFEVQARHMYARLGAF